MTLSPFAMGVHPPERLIQVERIAYLLGQPGGVTMSRLVEATRERRDVLSDDLETMRDDLGYPIRWNPDSGAYYLAERQPREGQKVTDIDLELLYRAIALQEYLYVIAETAPGEWKRLHGLPGKIRHKNGSPQFKLRERDGTTHVLDLAAVSEVTEAFGMNK